MLNTGTDQLDHLLNIGQIDRCGLGFKGKSSKGGCVFVSAGATENVATYTTKPAVKSSRGTVTDGKATTDDVKVATATATAAKASTVTVPKTGEVTAARTAKVFQAVEGETSDEETYGMRFHNPVCYCGGLNSGHRANHGRIRLMDTWSGRSGHYGDGGMSFYPQYGGWLMAVTPPNRFRHSSYSSASAMVLSTGHLQKDVRRPNKIILPTHKGHRKSLHYYTTQAYALGNRPVTVLNQNRRAPVLYQTRRGLSHPRVTLDLGDQAKLNRAHHFPDHDRLSGTI
ncbi:hypothetical protein F2Q69_00027538 [Brassica cretica]|uniref:Uncharacterized protein n=1 Tax=Brassica cretica TaxID=69181 RepID=A0A8S9RWV0_BRACR|nr:hypothetical protein F2Q69_00027538 [Brassica cretica]